MEIVRNDFARLHQTESDSAAQLQSASVVRCQLVGAMVSRQLECYVIIADMLIYLFWLLQITLAQSLLYSIQGGDDISVVSDLLKRATLEDINSSPHSVRYVD
jgi:hypothetical protein